MIRAYVLRGQGGFLTSLGMVALANMIRKRFGDGVEVSEHSWWDQQRVSDDIRGQPGETKIVIIGYSLGASAIPTIAASLRRNIHLAVAYDPSVWSPQRRDLPDNVLRCVLYHGVGWSMLGHAMFTGKHLEVIPVGGPHETMDFDKRLHDKTITAMEALL